MASWYELNATVTLSVTAGSGATVALRVVAPDGTASTPSATFSGSQWSATVTGDQPSSSGTHQGLIRMLVDRFGHLMHEMGKFGMVGALAFVIDLGGTNLMRYGVGLGALTSKVLATIIAATASRAGWPGSTSCSSCSTASDC